jgi:tRNA A-37 threonylcarbamoyl transferase component Bud32
VWTWGKVIVVLLAGVLLGCGGAGSADEVQISDWTLVSPLGTSAVKLPTHLNDRLPSELSSYSLRTELPLPASFQGKTLTLTARVPALATLRVDGHEAVALDTSAFDRYRNDGPHRWRVSAEYTRRPTVELEMDVEHTWAQSGWFDWTPTLSATPAGDTRFIVVTGFNQSAAISALVSMLLVSFLYGVVFLGDRTRKVHAWHSVQGVLASFYPAVLLGYTQPLFGYRDVPVAALAIAGSAICSIYFVASIFELPRPSQTWWLFLALVTVPAAIWGGPFEVTAAVAPGLVVTLLAASIYGVTTLFRAWRRGPVPPGALFAALGFPIAFVLGIPDATSLLGFGTPAWGFKTGSLAIAAISMLEALALSRSHSASLRRTDELNVQLQARVALLEANNREIGVLNGELRRQVATRSQHLADALARLGPVFARPRDFEPGEIVDERYRVVRRIGEGGMGKVYEVERLPDGRRLALKVLQGQRSGAELSRLAQEAEMASHINHPNVVGMFDVDVSASGAVFLVMEYVDGSSLDELSARYGDATWALGVLRQVAEGLAVMHEKEIVHRDLKPGNVLVTRDPSGGALAKIADFGIATRSGSNDETTAPLDEVAAASERTVDDPVAQANAMARATTDRSLTRTGQVLGTPLYMAPELARGAKFASAASDVYAVGVMAFELLTGKVPSGYETLDHLRNRSTPAPSFTKHTPALSPGLAALFERCLAREPGIRPTARELADALSC